MAKDNSQIIFYQQWVAAWQQVDKYSSQPWCVDSKNLDIFSDSQSVKAMAWSSKTPVDTSWVDIDPKERFYLASDGRVYDSVEDEWYNHDYFDTNANDINYWSWYNKAVFWTPKKLFVAYSWDEWKTITIVTDRLIYNIYSDWIHVQAGWAATGIRSWEKCTDRQWYEVSATSVITNNTWTKTDRISCKFANSASQIYFTPWGFHATAFSDQVCMRAKMSITTVGSPFKDLEATVYSSDFYWDQVDKVFEAYWNATKIHYHNFERVDSWNTVEMETYFDNSATWSNYNNPYWVYIHAICESPDAWLDVRFYKKEDWEYLYPKDRNFIEIEDEVYMQGLDSTQYYRLSYDTMDDQDWVPYYEITTTNAFDLPDWYDIVAFARGFDYQYAFVNKWDMWIVYYMTDVHLATWDVGRRFPWTQFINAIMIGNYVYVLAEKRGVRGLYIFSNWDMKKIIWAENRYTEWLNLVNGREFYNFTGLMANWRDCVVCPTEDKVFMYGRNKLGSNVWAFILKVDWEIIDVKTERWYLDIIYEQGLDTYRQTLQDDVNIRRYESDFNVTYPLQISSHINEKEPLKLAISYFLPNSETKLEAYLSVNDYYFWSFKTDWNTTPNVWDKFKMVWCGWTYWLVFVEKRGSWLTFKLEWDLPYQINNTKQLKSEDNTVTIAYSDFNHFKYIGECNKTDFAETEGKHTLLNITTVNNLPIVRKAQVKIVGKTDNHVSPELYDVRLLSNQYDK